MRKEVKVNGLSDQSRLLVRMVNEIKEKTKPFTKSYRLPYEAIPLLDEIREHAGVYSSEESYAINQRLEKCLDEFVRSNMENEERRFPAYLRFKEKHQDNIFSNFVDLYKRKHTYIIDDFFSELYMKVDSLSPDSLVDPIPSPNQVSMASNKPIHSAISAEKNRFNPSVDSPGLVRDRSSYNNSSPRPKSNNLTIKVNPVDPTIKSKDSPEFDTPSERRGCESDKQSPSISSKSQQEYAMSVTKKKKPKIGIGAVEKKSKNVSNQVEKEADDRAFFAHRKDYRRNTSNDILEGSPSIRSSITKDDRRIIKYRAASFDILMRNARYLKTYIKNIPLKKQEIQDMIECVYFDCQTLVNVLEDNRIEKNNTKTLHKVREIIQDAKKKPKNQIKINYSAKETFKFLSFMNLITSDTLSTLVSLYEKYDERIGNAIFDFDKRKDLGQYAEKLEKISKEVVEERIEIQKRQRERSMKHREQWKRLVNKFDISSTGRLEKFSPDWVKLEQAKHSILTWHDIYYSRETNEFLKKVARCKFRTSILMIRLWWSLF